MYQIHPDQVELGGWSCAAIENERNGRTFIFWCKAFETKERYMSLLNISSFLIRELLAIGRRMAVAVAVDEECFRCSGLDDSAGFGVGSGSMFRDSGPALGGLFVKRE